MFDEELYRKSGRSFVVEVALDGLLDSGSDSEEIGRVKVLIGGFWGRNRLEELPL